MKKLLLFSIIVGVSILLTGCSTKSSLYTDHVATLNEVDKYSINVNGLTILVDNQLEQIFVKDSYNNLIKIIAQEDDNVYGYQYMPGQIYSNDIEWMRYTITDDFGYGTDGDLVDDVIAPCDDLWEDTTDTYQMCETTITLDQTGEDLQLFLEEILGEYYPEELANYSVNLQALYEPEDHFVSKIKIDFEQLLDDLGLDTGLGAVTSVIMWYDITVDFDYEIPTDFIENESMSLDDFMAR